MNVQELQDAVNNLIRLQEEAHELQTKAAQQRNQIETMLTCPNCGNSIMYEWRENSIRCSQCGFSTGIAESLAELFERFVEISNVCERVNKKYEKG